MGSTTLDREDLLKAVEPDNAYYFQNQALVAGRDININQDPPPDLVIEIDITHTDIQKLSLYASLGVPEFWRYNGQILRIYKLDNKLEKEYVEVEVSPTFSQVPKSKLYQFLVESKQDEIDAELSLRKWIREIRKD